MVPSQSLRAHLSRQLVRRRGRAAVGVEIQTLYGLARQVLERARVAVSPARLVFPILVRREARRHASLRAHLDDLRDGYGVVAATVADLLDAGLDVEGASADVLLALAEGNPAWDARASALVRVADDVQSRMRRDGLLRDAGLFVRASAVVSADPDATLCARAILVHGFADATGAATLWIGTLQRSCGAEVFLDEPPDAVRAEAADVGVEFSRRFASALERAGAREELQRSVPATRPRLRSAAGTDAEVRAVARDVHALLCKGSEPESVGIVARTLEPYAVALRVHLARLGIPFSGLGEWGPRGPEGRRILALLELARRRERTSIDTWLDALGPFRLQRGADGTPRGGGRSRGARMGSRTLNDLRVGLHSVGAGRLGDVAALDPEAVLRGASVLSLPIRRGLEFAGRDEDAPDAEPKTYASRRKLPGDALVAGVEAARRLLDAWEQWPDGAATREHMRRLRELLAAELGWESERAALLTETIERGCPPAFQLDYDDLLTLLQGGLQDRGRVPLGGAGAGVQVLDVTQARARSFQHLFVLGANRDLFPRVITEDPLLSDTARRALQPALPAIPIKGEGHAEERFLFAQLLAAAPHVTLSWQSADDEGKARAPSPLVERLRLSDACDELTPAPSLYAPPAPNGPDADPGGSDRAAAPRPAYEHAVLAGLYAPRSHFARTFACALSERAALLNQSEPERPNLADARIAILCEVDPDVRTRRKLGPYFGFVGALRHGEGNGTPDPRHRDLYVTTLEGLARCPWQAFVQKLLRVEETPDSLSSLPALDPLLVGAGVHAVLERIVAEALGPEPPTALAAALERDPTPVPWPDPERLERILNECCEQALRAAGVGLGGFARALAARVRPYLDVARARDWRAPVAALGAEVEGVAELALSGDPVRIHFRADRVERVHERIRLTDYKTGTPAYASIKGAEKRLEKLLRDIESGRFLQALAYQLGTDPEHAEGRYLYLQPDAPETAVVLAAPPGDPRYVAAFTRSVDSLWAAWRAGAFFPRITSGEGGTPRACDWCDVKQACLQGDSGHRARLREWAARRELETPAEPESERTALDALLAVWQLAEGDAA